MFVGLVGQLADQVAALGRGESRVYRFANNAKPEQREVFAWISAHAHLVSGRWRHPTCSACLRRGRASVGPQRVAAADETPETPHRRPAFTEAGSSSLPGSPERFEDGGFALTCQEHRGWVQLHGHGHQRRHQGWGTQLEATPPPTRRGHRHPYPIRHTPHAQPTDDAEGQSVADDLDRV